MNGKERRSTRRHSEFANLPEVTEADRAALASPVGHDDDAGVLAPHGSLADAEVHAHDVSAQPQSEVTDPHLPGDDQDSEDGLNETEEAVRDAAETDSASGRRKPLRF